jgi:hypothetical protein
VTDGLIAHPRAIPLTDAGTWISTSGTPSGGSASDSSRTPQTIERPRNALPRCSGAVQDRHRQQG